MDSLLLQGNFLTKPITFVTVYCYNSFLGFFFQYDIIQHPFIQIFWSLIYTE